MDTVHWDERYFVSRNTFLVTSWITFSIGSACFFARIAIRLHVFSHCSFDDLLVLLAWLCSITWTIAWQIGSNSLYLILYMQTQKIPIDGKSYLEHEQRNLIISMIATCSQLIGLWCIKYAFLAFLWNLGPKDGIKTHKIMWWFAVSYGLVALVISMAVLPWPCLITNQDWRTFAKRCTTRTKARKMMRILRIQMVFDVTSDVAILSLPLCLLWQVKLPLRRKITPVIIFSLTLIVALYAILRVVIVEKTAVDSFVDITWMFLWSKIELDVAIVVGCLVSFRAFVTRRRKNSSFGDEIAQFRLPAFDPPVIENVPGTINTQDGQEENNRASNSHGEYMGPNGMHGVAWWK